MPSAGDIVAGSVRIRLESTNNLQCKKVQDSVTVIFTQPVTVNVGVDVNSCKNYPITPLNAAITGTSTGLVTGGGADGIGAVKTNFFGQYPNVNTVASLGADLGFYAITRPATTGGLNQQVKSQFLQDSSTAGDVWNLSASGLLTYTTASVAAVPEADTSAMMLAGLGLMGFVARRRRA